jgi:hypothetical protein
MFLKTSRNGPREETKTRLNSSVIGIQKTGDASDKKDLLDELEDLDKTTACIPNFPVLDPNLSEDAKEFHETLIRQLDVLVNHTFNNIAGKMDGNHLMTLMPPTVAGGNVISRLSNRYSKRSRTPNQMFKRDNRITNN